MRTSDAIEGIEQMALWTPALIPSDLARWYDASLLTGTPGSTRFASLSDLSGNGKTLTSSRGPLLRQANYSSLTLPSIEFDGASGGDTLGGTSTQTISGFQSACISQAYITRTNMRAFEMSGAVSGSELVGWSGGVFHQNQTPGIKLTLHARTTATKIGAYACIGNAISHAGSPPYTATSVDTSSSYFLHGLFGEVVVTNKTVSTIVYEAIQGYMAWKWKPESAATLLGSGHRYEFNAPTVGPTNTTAPTLYDDGTTDSGVWDSHSGGTITYTTYLYDASDDSLVHTLYTEDADFSSYVTSGDTYYIVVRAANDLGYDSAEDTPSADETIAGGGDADNTASAALTLGGLSFSGAGSFTAPIYEATAALSLGSLSFSGAAAVTNPTYEAAADLSLGGLQLAASGTFSVDTFTGSAALALGGLELSGSASVVNPSYTGEADLTLGGLIFAGSGATSVNTFTAEAALTLGGIEFDGSAAFTAPVYSGEASLTLGGLEVDGVASFATATFTGTAGLELGGLTFAGSGTVDVPVMTASADLTLGGIEFAGADVASNDSAIFLNYYLNMGAQG